MDVWWEFGLDVDISERIKPTFEVLPKRWIVERTFAWLGNSRRLSKDYEISVDSSENMLYIANMHLLLKQLARVEYRFLILKVIFRSKCHMRSHFKYNIYQSKA